MTFSPYSFKDIRLAGITQVYIDVSDGFLQLLLAVPPCGRVNWFEPQSDDVADPLAPQRKWICKDGLLRRIIC